MHKIEHLLHTLAPKGVEFKTLEEVFEIRNGYTPSKNNPEFWKNGTIPWFRMEDLRENGRILKDSIQHITPKALKGKKLFPKNSIIISTTATIGEHALLIVDSLANQRFTFLSKKANCDLALDMKFFFYQCFLLGEWCKNNINVSGFASVDMTAFKKYKFPIPPLEIQQEIVKILDAFTELNTELNARKKQYQYYQNMLLDFNDINQNHKDAKERLAQKPYPKRLKTLLQTLAPKGVGFRKLGEVCEIIRGKRVTKKEILDKGKYPVVSGGIGFMGYLNEYNREENTITIAQYGTAGFVNWQNQKFWANDVCFSVIPKETLINRYLYYVLTNMQNYLYSISNRSAIPYSISSNNIMQIIIPIPPLEIQQEIVKILDQFSLLTTDLLAGIPAEIKARKKQYEYYREKLLAFKPLTPQKEVKKD
ncbi:restriction endonuclease subunit S [Helicobacter pylori]|uniref:restriction endonuclease subunit S n=1 Tax=Helicobacter pylori TaxID=210 RepID=UPI000BEA1D59|nr:restriction endonuclease subunit S [Helicobacter pylori]PDW38185.1 restriction endonuclease subunit S [Helicobacter pylori]RPF63352.1 restriction endonuclease subunit S [Helicobacter pylori]WQU54121.1 restriction endonuclease subunit S [Helicobacter pylori]